jgi:hypothetical protein
MKRFLWGLLLLLVVCGAAGWYWQSQIIGVAGRWYMSRMAAREDRSGSLDERRKLLAQMNRYMLMPPPDDALVPELFDLTTQLSARVATGEISLNWAAYIYTAYQRDLVQQRPDGKPRRSSDEVAAQLAQYVRFFSIQKRPDQRGVTMGDLMGKEGDEVITLDEIEESERTGKEIDLRNRGVH